MVLVNLVCLAGNAQVQFSAESLPHQLGDYYRGYLSTNVGVGALIGQPGGPQRWDLSQSRQPNETIQRTDVVTPDDGGQGASFPEAAFAERDTDELGNQTAWRYYTLTNQGRLYYGFYCPVDDPATPLVVFDHPTVDVPAAVQYGQTWNRGVAWTNVVLSLYLVAYQFTASAQVDAYGTLALPGLSEAPALRVKEVHDYEVSEKIGGNWYLIDSHTNVFYYWLSPSIGMPLQVILYGNNVIYPAPLPSTNWVLRVFETSAATNPPSAQPVADLCIRLQTGQAMLDWRSATNGSGYRVEGLPSLGDTNWQLLGQPSTNSWSEAVALQQRFYRVFALP